MSLSSMSIFAMAQSKMSWLGQRQTVLAQNIANADTPSYRAKDLEALDFQKVMRAQRVTKLAMAHTNEGHFATLAKTGDYRVTRAHEIDVYEVNPSGNAVILEEQMIKLSENNVQYQLAANIYQKNLTMLRLAVSGGTK